ncbi:MAG TPA: endo-1,4-beta-xylanase [Lachnospiraceae bacterium]
MGSINHRKAKVKVTLKKKDGQPLSNKKVDYKQINHEFLFGCNVFDALPFVDKATDPKRKEILDERMKMWLDLFNFGTLPFYWGRYEEKEGVTIKDTMMEAAKFLKSKNITLKGHPLCWHTVCADWLLQYDNETILKKQVERIHREVTDFKGLIDMWDAINEVVIMPIFDKYDNAVTRLCNEHGRVGLVKKVFEEAKIANPNASFLINDFNTTANYEHLIEDLLEAEVPLTHIGIQSHQHQGYWGIDKIQDVLERFSRFHLPIHFTENTIISGKLMPKEIEDLNDYVVSDWPTTPEGEDRQAKEVIEMYETLFAHPSVEAITTWDFDDDNKWLGAPCGLIRKDNSPKPVYGELMKKIHGEWESKGLVHTDDKGSLELEVFKGDYELEIDGKIYSINTKQEVYELTVD